MEACKRNVHDRYVKIRIRNLKRLKPKNNKVYRKWKIYFVLSFILALIIVYFGFFVLEGLEHKDPNTIFGAIDTSSHCLSNQILMEMTIKLESLCNEFNKLGIDYFVTDGTLISLIRHNGNLMKWDDDIDIGIFINDHQTVLQFFSSNQINYELYA
eukprot:287805_1